MFDLMEPEQPKVNRAILSFLKSEVLHPADFMVRDGVVRLSPELARHMSRGHPPIVRIAPICERSLIMHEPAFLIRKLHV
jgi:hypothetical protein